MPPERKYPYDFNIILVGYFNVAEMVPEEQRELYIKVSAASILYSAAREALATATGRGPLPCVVLPPVVFTVNAEGKEAEPATRSTDGGKGTRRKATKKGGAKKTGVKKQQR
jgi:preprotein translocase subunit SecB